MPRIERNVLLEKFRAPTASARNSETVLVRSRAVWGLLSERRKGEGELAADECYLALDAVETLCDGGHIRLEPCKETDLDPDDDPGCGYSDGAGFHLIARQLLAMIHGVSHTEGG